mmetsp:Transcript_854/g.2499  ORF Transcript_854/g.2499 Transcript_854/m.2499 type:complete len:205 (+) Transcript_854:543-1157(+)
MRERCLWTKTKPRLDLAARAKLPLLPVRILLRMLMEISSLKNRSRSIWPKERRSRTRTGTTSTSAQCSTPNLRPPKPLPFLLNNPKFSWTRTPASAAPISAARASPRATRLPPPAPGDLCGGAPPSALTPRSTRRRRCVKCRSKTSRCATPRRRPRSGGRPRTKSRRASSSPTRSPRSRPASRPTPRQGARSTRMRTRRGFRRP